MQVVAYKGVEPRYNDRDYSATVPYVNKSFKEAFQMSDKNLNEEAKINGMDQISAENLKLISGGDAADRYKCPVCGKQFYTGTAISLHMKNEHPKTNNWSWFTLRRKPTKYNIKITVTLPLSGRVTVAFFERPVSERTLSVQLFIVGSTWHKVLG